MQSHVDVGRKYGNEKQDQPQATHPACTPYQHRSATQHLEEAAHVYELEMRRKVGRHDRDVEAGIHEVIRSRQDEEQGEHEERDAPRSNVGKIEHDSRG